MSKATKKKTSKSTTTRAKKKDNREGTRVPIQLLVDYRCDGHYLFDFCRDLGTGGVFIETKSPLPQGSSINLTFTIPDSKETLMARGKVIWVQSPVTNRKDLTPGMGVQFDGFTAQQRQVLEDFVKRYSSSNPQPGTMEARSAS